MVLPKMQLPAVETRLQQLSAACNGPLAAHKLARQVMASCTHQHFTPFSKGDKVWLEARNLKRHIINPKFVPKREGPFTITKVLSPIVYQLCLLKPGKFTLCSMLLSYHPIAKMMYMDQTSWPHHLTLLPEKKSMKLRKLYATEEPQDTTPS